MIIWSIPQITIQDYLTVVSMVIVYYDHIITLDEEQRFIWNRWNTTGSWLFFINRYFALLSTSTWAASFLPWRTVERSVYLILPGRLSTSNADFLFQLQSILLLSTDCGCLDRINCNIVYALYGRSKRMALFAVTVFGALIGVCGWRLTGQQTLTVIVDGCHIALATGTKLVVAWEGLLALDILIFVLTFFKTYKAIRETSVVLYSGSLLSLMFRDGAMYYVTLTCANLANVVTFYLLPPMLMGCLSSVAGSISMAMLSRMMLNLHKRAELSRNLVPSTTGGLPLSTFDFVGRRISFAQEDIANDSTRHKPEDATVTVHTDVEIARLSSPTYASGERSLVE